MKTTITEALAELKTIDKRVQKKMEFCLGAGTLVRQEMLKDPHEKEGGAKKLIAQERQAIKDLHTRKIDIRRAILDANMRETITVENTTHTINDWLVWRREVVQNEKGFLDNMIRNIDRTRQDAQRKGVNVSEKETGSPTNVVVNINEKELSEETEMIEKILGDLDGKLSLKNATTMIDV